MPKGTWIREQTNERTAHRVPRLRGPTAADTRVTWAFMVHVHVAHTTRHVSWVSDRALPDDARCIRPPFPRSSIRAAQPAIWSETWYGQVPGSRTARLVVFSSGETKAANLRIRAHRSESQTGTSIRRPSGGWLSRGFPGSPALVAPPIDNKKEYNFTSPLLAVQFCCLSHYNQTTCSFLPAASPGPCSCRILLLVSL